MAPSSCCVPDKPHVGNDKERGWINGFEWGEVDTFALGMHGTVIRERLQAIPGCPIVRLSNKIQTPGYWEAQSWRDEGVTWSCHCCRSRQQSTLLGKWSCYRCIRHVLLTIHISDQLCLQSWLHQEKANSKKQKEGVFVLFGREIVENNWDLLVFES